MSILSVIHRSLNSSVETPIFEADSSRLREFSIVCLMKCTAIVLNFFSFADDSDGFFVRYEFFPFGR